MSIELSGLVFTPSICLVVFIFWLIFRKRATSASIVAQQASRRKSRSPKPPKPGHPDLCPLCKEDAAQHLSLRQCLYILTRPETTPWSQLKGKGGHRKSIDSDGVIALPSLRLLWHRRLPPASTPLSPTCLPPSRCSP